MIQSINPSTGQILGEVSETSNKEIEQIFLNAKKTQKEWKKLSLQERKIILSEVLKAFRNNKEKIAQSISQEMGMPIVQAYDEVEYGCMYFQGYLDIAEKYLIPHVTRENEKEKHTVFYEPKGVVLALAPWNYPFSMFVWTSIQPLLAGNSVVFKTSKEVILTGKIIEDIIVSTSLPKGVWTEVYGGGSMGDILLQQDIQAVTFTGSTEVGKYIYTKCAEKFIPCMLELGGSAPGIVCSDADIDAVIENIYFNRFSNCGQMCDGLKRLIVHTSKYDEVEEKLSKVFQTKKVGISTEKTTDIGPLVNTDQLKNIQIQYDDAIKLGAKIISQINISSELQGDFFSPTILGNITKDMKVWKEEVFGPILPIVPFETLEEAINLANDTLYGLGSYIFTQNKDTFYRVAHILETGEVQHNTLNYCIPESPFGGYKNSGIGREHGKWGFHEFCNIKVITEMK